MHLSMHFCKRKTLIVKMKSRQGSKWTNKQTEVRWVLCKGKQLVFIPCPQFALLSLFLFCASCCCFLTRLACTTVLGSERCRTTPHCLTVLQRRKQTFVGLQFWDTGLWWVLLLCMFVHSLKHWNYKPDTKRMTCEFLLSLPCHFFIFCLLNAEALCCRWVSARSGTQGLGKERSTWWNLLHSLHKCNLNLVMYVMILMLKRNLETISFPISLDLTPGWMTKC